MLTEEHNSALAQLEQFVSVKSFTSPSFCALVEKLKLLVAQLDSLDPTNNIHNPEEIQFARYFNELNVFSSLQMNNIEEFERAMSRLLVFYDDYKNSLPKSNNQNQLVAVYLLYLLSFNKVSDFHSRLETISLEDLKDQHISYVTQLEVSLTEGNYKKMNELVKLSTSTYFSVFLGRIEDTIRYEIARSAEKAYVSLLVNDAVKIFNLKSRAELSDYVIKEEANAAENEVKWRLDADRLYFDPIVEEKRTIKADGLISTMLNYSHELERII